MRVLKKSQIVYIDYSFLYFKKKRKQVETLPVISYVGEKKKTAAYLKKKERKQKKRRKQILNVKKRDVIWPCSTLRLRTAKLWRAGLAHAPGTGQTAKIV